MAGLQLLDAVEVLLVVALAALALGLAVVVFLLQLGEALLLALQFGFEDAPGVAVARALLGGIDALAGGRAAGGRCTAADAGLAAGARGLGAAITVTGAPSSVRQPWSRASLALRASV